MGAMDDSTDAAKVKTRHVELAIQAALAAAASRDDRDRADRLSRTLRKPSSPLAEIPTEPVGRSSSPAA